MPILLDTSVLARWVDESGPNHGLVTAGLLGLHRDDPVDLRQRCLDLVTTHRVSGRPAHDARLVAFMEGHGLTRLLTLNGDDFKKFPGIVPVHPKDV